MALFDLPAIGTFLRPIGLIRYGYCLRVMRQFHGSAVEEPGIEYERWGMQDGLPCDDGHVKRGYYIDLLPGPAPDVWAYTCRFGIYSAAWAEPLYYRAIGCDDSGQQELFA